MLQLAVQIHMYAMVSEQMRQRAHARTRCKEAAAGSSGSRKQGEMCACMCLHEQASGWMRMTREAGEGNEWKERQNTFCCRTRRDWLLQLTAGPAEGGGGKEPTIGSEKWTINRS